MRTQTRPLDTAAEERIARHCEAAWTGAQFHRYGFFDTIDWWVERDGRCVAVAEVKNRDCLPTTYPTIYLALRKWLALSMASLAGATPLFIVGFSDLSVRYVNVLEVDARRMGVAGRHDRPGMPNDIEPIISVPVDMMSIVPHKVSQPDETIGA